MPFIYAVVWNLSRTLIFLLGGRSYGAENIPGSGAFILASNHISYFDPPFVASYTRRSLHFFAKKELFDIPIFGSILRRVQAHPVRRGVFDRTAIKTAIAILKDGDPLVVFPEGTRGGGKEFLKPRPGVGMIARECEVPILPCYIHGSNQAKSCLLRRAKLSVSYGTVIDSGWIQSCPLGRDGWEMITEEAMRRILLLKTRFAESQINSKGPLLKESSSEHGAT